MNSFNATMHSSVFYSLYNSITKANMKLYVVTKRPDIKQTSIPLYIFHLNENKVYSKRFIYSYFHHILLK